MLLSAALRQKCSSKKEFIMDCLFCKIISGDIPSQKVYESETVVAFKDINPQAPVHILIIPKFHIESLAEITEDTVGVTAEIMLVAKQLAQEFSLGNGYRVITNIGDDGGQTVHHLHFHLIGGKKLSEQMC